MKISKRFKKFRKNFFKIIKKPEMSILPGQLAYSLVLAIIPTITLVTIIASVLNLSTDVLSDFLSNAFSSDLANTLLSSSDSFNNDISVLVILAFGYLIASNGASSIIITSNTIYGIKNSNFAKRYIKSSVMILILLFLLIILLLIPMFGDIIINLLTENGTNIEIIGNITFTIKFMQGPILWIMLFMFIKLIYTMAPDKKIDTKYVNYGALFTTFCWVGITYLYSIYVTEIANYEVLYGQLANLVILMLWFYFLSFSFTIGLAFNYHKEEEEKFKELVLNK